MTKPEPLTEEWFDAVERSGTTDFESSHNTDTPTMIREVAAAALEWAADYYSTGRPVLGHQKFDAGLRAKAQEVRRG